MEEKRACVYVRVSTNEQAEEGYSIEEQERRCIGAIASKGWKYIGTYSDPGVSGRSMDRDGLQLMIKDIQLGKIEAVVIYKLDRLSRRQRDTMVLLEDVFLKNDVALMSLNETLDTSTPWGRAMIGILSSFNQMECENIRERTMMGRLAKAQKGEYAGGRPPYGYKVSDGELVINEDQAFAVRLIFKLRKNFKSTRQICEELELRDIAPPAKGDKWQSGSVSAILRNEEVYLGTYTYRGLTHQIPPILWENARWDRQELPK